MKTNSIFRILVLCIVLLTLNSHYAFSRAHPTEREVDQSQSTILLIGDHQGIDETDIQSVAMLTAQELRKQDIHVGDPVYATPTSGTIYRVVLHRSDENEKILFRLSEEDTAGTIIVEREILLMDIEEIVSAVPRLIYALVHRKPIVTSSSLVNAGVFTAIVPVKEVLAPGVRIGLSIDRLSYAMDVGFQVAWMETAFQATAGGNQSERKDSFHFYSASIGGRYFFMKQNVSPYMGGGLGMMFTKYKTTIKTPNSPDNALEAIAIIFTAGQSLWDYNIYSEETDGIGAYGVLGIEFLRFSRGRLNLELRVDRPFFKLPTQDVMPITLGITGCWSF